MTWLREFVVALTYPPALSFWLLLVALLLLAVRWPRSGATVVGLALAWSVLWSIPVASDWLRSLLERRHPVVAEAALPQADAIVVLGGGGGYRWMGRPEVDAYDLHSSRIAAGARVWLAGRAPVVILSGGGEGDNTEAQKMARAIERLGVPRASLILEEQSQSTSDNARYTAMLAERKNFRSVLLVTSSLHMPRANLQFREAGLVVIPVPVPERATRRHWRDRWVPSRSAMRRSARAFKEFAGLSAAHLDV